MIGQATIGKEIFEQMGEDSLDAIFISVGGGGLIGGIAAYLKDKMPSCKIYGVQPENSQVMFMSIKAGKILQNVKEFETISDGTAGGIEEDCVSFEFCQKFVDEWILVSEQEIKDAMFWIAEKEKFIIEGSAGVAVAGYLKSNLKKKKVAIVLCGRNISMEKFSTCFPFHKK
jgi:threonine dehydratase